METTNKPSRDPRIDPQPGDILLVGEPGNRDEVLVNFVSDTIVLYCIKDGFYLEKPGPPVLINTWQDMTRDATVLRSIGNNESTS